jgi:hypothetical protein
MNTRTVLLGVAALTLSGCALAPNTIRTEAEHISHASQHFGANRTNMGSESVNVIAQWRFGNAYIEAGEGYNLSPAERGKPCDGGLCGPREMFTAAVGYSFEVRK